MGKTIAIVGASSDRRKFGNKAVRAYRDGGWVVYPVNPRADEIEGIKAYHSLKEVPEPIERVSMYVPTSVGLSMLDEIAAKRPGEVFLNPGSESDELIRAMRAQGLNVINACSIVNIGLTPEMYSDE